MQHGELRSYCGSRLVNEFFLQFSLFNINDTFKTGDWSSYIFLKLVYFTNHNCVKRQWDQSKRRPEWDRYLSSICDKWTCWTERTGRPVDQANQKSKNRIKARRPRVRTERPVLFRHTGMAARIQGKSRGWKGSWTQRLTRQCPVQKTHWRSRTSCRKFWWFDNSRSQSSQWRLRISEQSPIEIVVQDLATQWIQAYPCTNKNFAGNTKELAKVLGAR